MTCIVGVLDGDALWIGADSAASNEELIETLAAPKVFHPGADDEFLIGCSGSIRVLQLVAHAFEPPPRSARQTLSAYMTTAFVDTLRTVLANGGTMSEEDSVQTIPCELVVGHAGRLFTVQSDMAVIEYAFPFSAAGSGSYYAMGAMHAAGRRKLKPRSLAVAGLEAAACFDPFVREPFVLERLG